MGPRIGASNPVSAVRFAPDGTLYAISSGPSSVAPEGLYRRENNGSWTPLGPNQGPLFESDLNAVRFSRNNASLILLGGSDFGVAGSEATIWRSTDAGQGWNKVYEVGESDKVTDLEIIEDGTDQNMVAAWTSLNGDNIGGALRSTDNGASWFGSSPGLPVFLRDPRLCGSPVILRSFSCPSGLASSPVVCSVPLTAVQLGLPPVGRELTPSEMLPVIQSTIRCSLLLN